MQRVLKPGKTGGQQNGKTRVRVDFLEGGPVPPFPWRHARTMDRPWAAKNKSVVRRFR